MAKKCPPGVICVENITLVIIVSILGIIGYLIYIRTNSSRASYHKQESSSSNYHYHSEPTLSSHYEMLMKPSPSHGYTNNPTDIFLNPHTPPVNIANMLSASTPMDHPHVPAGRMPVNVSTNIGHRNTSYSQMGMLTPMGGGNIGGHEKILPLFGRQLHTSRQKWQYYTMSNNNNSVKLPVIKNGRSCTNEYGCDELSNGETVYVEGYNQAFKVTVYENDAIQYIPYI